MVRPPFYADLLARSEHLVEGEEIIYQSPILLRSGLLLPKRRTLALTSLPRLICVKEDAATETIKVQAECLFKLSDEVEQVGGHREAKDHEVAKKRLVKRFYEKAPRAFVVQTVSGRDMSISSCLICRITVRRGKRSGYSSRIAMTYAQDG